MQAGSIPGFRGSWTSTRQALWRIIRRRECEILVEALEQAAMELHDPHEAFMSPYRELAGVIIDRGVSEGNTLDYMGLPSPFRRVVAIEG